MTGAGRAGCERSRDLRLRGRFRYPVCRSNGLVSGTYVGRGRAVVGGAAWPGDGRLLLPGPLHLLRAARARAQAARPRPPPPAAARPRLTPASPISRHLHFAFAASFWSNWINKSSRQNITVKIVLRVFSYFGHKLVLKFSCFPFGRGK